MTIDRENFVEVVRELEADDLVRHCRGWCGRNRPQRRRERPRDFDVAGGGPTRGNLSHGQAHHALVGRVGVGLGLDVVRDDD
jgi:hypothetical protein